MFLLRGLLMMMVFSYALLRGATPVQLITLMVVVVAVAISSQMLLGPLWMSLGSRTRPGDADLLDKAAQATRTVADRLGLDPPQVVLLPGSNAVWARGSSRRVLGIGRDWVRDMTPRQLTGVVAHEFGHDDRRFFEQQAALLAGEVLVPALAALLALGVLLAGDLFAEPSQANWRAVTVLALTWAAARGFHLAAVLPRRRAEELAADDFAVDHGFGPHLHDALATCRPVRRPLWAATHPATSARRHRVAHRLQQQSEAPPLP